ncbi:biopolymer transporter Tol [Leucobacter sp. USHLN153]|uniref:biopolymer transporter Tol n=1 Tax=Leucobacter sp. USHLN153 TaxID=3081268 RepID=UPI003018E99D
MTAPERTPDGRFIIVNGRKWRASDPVLPEELAAALRSELGSARSRIGHTSEERERRGLRDRVQLAKEGLGERGTAWWEMEEAERIARAEDRLERLRKLN